MGEEVHHTLSCTYVAHKMYMSRYRKDMRMNPKLGTSKNASNKGRLNNGLAHRLWRTKAVGHTGVTQSIRKSIKTGNDSEDKNKTNTGQCSRTPGQMTHISCICDPNQNHSSSKPISDRHACHNPPRLRLRTHDSDSDTFTH